MKRFTRRQLGAAALLAAPIEAAEPAYTGALDGLEAKVPLAKFDPVDWTLRRYEEMPRQLRFRAENRKAAEAWQKKLRAKVVELLGGFPATRTPLAPQTLEVKTFPGYRREKFVIETRPGLMSLGYLLTPATGQGPWPVVLCVPGHGRGVDDIVGIDAKGKPRTDKDGYQHDFAIQAVEAGMAAIAVEPMGFGCRRDARTKKRGLGNSACQPTAGAALLFGETMIAWRVYDLMRTIDWIETRPELDAKRVGCMGISGGGTCTTFAAAVEPRIRAAMVSGYLNSFRDSILSLAHCIDNYVPGILQWAEMADVAGLIAPRPLFLESGDRDDIFPVAASRQCFVDLQMIYSTFGAKERVEHEVFAGEHSFHGVRGIPFLKKALTA